MTRTATPPSRPGGIYDRMMRAIAEGDFVSLCAWLGVAVEGTFAFVSGSFTRETFHTDLPARVGTLAAP